MFLGSAVSPQQKLHDFIISDSGATVWQALIVDSGASRGTCWCAMKLIQSALESVKAVINKLGLMEQVLVFAPIGRRAFDHALEQGIRPSYSGVAGSISLTFTGALHEDEEGMAALAVCCALWQRFGLGKVKAQPLSTPPKPWVPQLIHVEDWVPSYSGRGQHRVWISRLQKYPGEESTWLDPFS